jgi:hypothetical protein
MNRLLLIIVCLLAVLYPKSLAASRESGHFVINYQPADAAVIDTIISVLEFNYSKVTSTLGLNLAGKTIVTVYPSIDEFHNAIGMPGAADWLVGVGGSEIKIVSPLNPGSAHSFSFILNPVLPHEFTHICTSKISNYIPYWMIEGYACYTVGPKASKSGVVSDYNEQGKVPSLNELNSFSNFASIGGYNFSYTIVQYMVETFGQASVIDFIYHPDNYTLFGGFTKDKFEIGWHHFIESKYLGFTPTDMSINTIQPEIQLFPNPFHNSITIKNISELEGETNIRVFNIEDKLLYNFFLSSGTNTMDFDFLPEGLYIFSVVQNNKTTQVKILKE